MDKENGSVSDRTVLTDGAYAHEKHLAARQGLYDFQTPVYDLPGIVLKLLEGRHPSLVLDVGCGNGRYTARFRNRFPETAVVGIDLAQGILAEVERPVIVADAAQLPFADNSADVVLGMHMLYHVDDVGTGIAELARVVTPTGTVFVSTNALEDKAELDALWHRAAAHVLGRPDPPQRISLSRRFSLDAAPEMMRQHFSTVKVHELPGQIRVTSVDPVIGHLTSYEPFARACDVPFEETIGVAEDLLQRHLDEYGEFAISCRGGIIECRTQTNRSASIQQGER